MTTGEALVRIHSFPDNCKPKETHSISSSTWDQEHLASKPPSWQGAVTSWHLFLLTPQSCRCQVTMPLHG